MSINLNPNIAARSMVLGYSDTVGLLLSKERYRSLLPEDLLNGIEEKLTELRLRLTVHRIPDDQLKDPQIVRHLCRALMVDGLLININSAIPEEMALHFKKYHIPGIWLNSRQSKDAVHPDDEPASRDATRHLLKLGHRRIAFVEDDQVTPETPMHYSLADRRQGYLAAMAKAGLPPRLIARGEAGYPPGSLEAVRPLLLAADRGILFETELKWVLKTLDLDSNG
ncbi:MAG: LacI family DNA-binding transcriptional regulator [Opitutales bacterium]